MRARALAHCAARAASRSHGADRILVIAAVPRSPACGRVRPSSSRRRQSLPVKPLMARATPTVEELLTPPPYARPDRVDELMKRSQPRPQDPFDLPPRPAERRPRCPPGPIPALLPTIRDPPPPERR